MDPMKLNEDGKFFDRLIPSLLSAGIAVLGMAVLFWADTRAADRETATAISRLEKKQDAIEAEQREQRQAASADRQKTAELAGDVRNVLRSTVRIETLLDRLTMPPAPR
ncbi:hypothetical protein SAMN04488115_108133 [Bosea lathyri]|uniref:Uncharacterized protein n=2 Tax=Bosea lathyri TaxID=1036778 RepID=A0A1H6BW16_9HYPH|nr:hypothetical protein SAMN04488115_108133 [Bosea lathyri]